MALLRALRLEILSGLLHPVRGEVINLLFLGTKGEIELSSPRHKYHSSLLLESGGTRLLVDYGRLRRYSLEELEPDAILVTHAHPDHYAWLEEGLKTGVPVYLTQETLDYGRYAPEEVRVIAPGEAFEVSPFRCLPYRVIHSIRCPAVGYKISAQGVTIIYNPDLVDIVGKNDILRGVDYYVGDGSSIRANLVRRRGEQFFGHTKITTQINWCKKYGISHIIFTHLGKEAIESEGDFAGEHPEAMLAYDGMELRIG